MDQRERISDGFVWVASIQNRPNIPDQLSAEVETLAAQLATAHEKLLTRITIQKLKIWSAYTYLLSLVGFLSASVLVFVYFWLYLSIHP